MKKRIGIIGCGQMGSAIALQLFKRRKFRDKFNLIVCDKNRKKARALAKALMGMVSGAY